MRPARRWNAGYDSDTNSDVSSGGNSSWGTCADSDADSDSNASHDGRRDAPPVHWVKGALPLRVVMQDSGQAAECLRRGPTYLPARKLTVGNMEQLRVEPKHVSVAQDLDTGMLYYFVAHAAPGVAQYRLSRRIQKRYFGHRLSLASLATTAVAAVGFSGRDAAWLFDDSAAVGAPMLFGPPTVKSGLEDTLKVTMQPLRMQHRQMPKHEFLDAVFLAFPWKGTDITSADVLMAEKILSHIDEQTPDTEPITYEPSKPTPYEPSKQGARWKNFATTVSDAQLDLSSIGNNDAIKTKGTQTNAVQVWIEAEPVFGRPMQGPTEVTYTPQPKELVVENTSRRIDPEILKTKFSKDSVGRAKIDGNDVYFVRHAFNTAQHRLTPAEYSSLDQTSLITLGSRHAAMSA